MGAEPLLSGAAKRRAAVVIAGFCSFVDLYAPQPLLPQLAVEFGATAADISLILSASALAIALVAPFTGALADVVGRKRVIVAAMFVLTIPTLMVALAPDLSGIVFWRFVQGLLLPPVFAVTIAYVGEELPPVEATILTGLYTSASSFGGFVGRFLAGVMADYVGWRSAFVVLAVLTLAGAVAIAFLLPREQSFVRAPGLGASLGRMLRHFRNRQLLAAYAVGFGVLFNFVAVFTYVSFHLALPPFALTATGLGAIFVVYLTGSVVAPWVGALAVALGRRRLITLTAIAYAASLVLTLVPSLPVIILGLAIFAGGGFIFQSLGTAYVAVTAKEGRSSAVGLYVTAYYLGGGVGAIIPGYAWEAAGWPACAALSIAMAGLIALIARLWRNEVGN